MKKKTDNLLYRKVDKISLILLIGLTMLFYACPYESEFPLKEASEAVMDPDLEGNWKVDGQEDTAIIMHVCGQEYLILGCQIESNAKVMLDTSIFRAFVTELDCGNFLNLQSIDILTGEKSSFIFAEYYFKKDSLIIKVIDDAIIESPVLSQKELISLIEKNRNNSKLYMEEMILTKSGSQMP